MDILPAISDARDLPPGTMLRTEVCIVGAGAAGITLATELASKGISVLLLEGGERRITSASQSLYRAEQHGLQYFDLAACRLRFLGGTTNHWAGVCRENDPIDFEARPELGKPGWPVGYHRIQPYVATAASRLGIDAQNFVPRRALSAVPDASTLLLDRRVEELETKVFLYATKLRFKDQYSAALQSSQSLRLLLNANVTAIRLAEGGQHVTHVEVKSTPSKTLKVHARRFVLAAHAIENARLLLASNDVLPAGIGNAGDHVGRYFMEHASILAGMFFPSPRFPKIYSLDFDRRLRVNSNLGLKAEALLKYNALQYYCRFRPIYDFERTEAALKRVRDGFWAPLDLRMLRALARVSQRPIESMRAAAYRLRAYLPDPVAYSLDHRIEQAPNPDSRVTLSHERDVLGVPIVRLNWQLNDVDYRSFAVGQRIVVSELTHLKMGRFKIQELEPDLICQSVRGHNHHIGTTRMGYSARDSVVNADCLVHGVSNLYVAGSSVFPSAGYSGPTMMIVAFALRLAEHLVARRAAA